MNDYTIENHFFVCNIIGNQSLKCTLFHPCGLWATIHVTKILVTILGGWHRVGNLYTESPKPRTQIKFVGLINEDDNPASYIQVLRHCLKFPPNTCNCQQEARIPIVYFARFHAYNNKAVLLRDTVRQIFRWESAAAAADRSRGLPVMFWMWRRHGVALWRHGRVAWHNCLLLTTASNVNCWVDVANHVTRLWQADDTENFERRIMG